MLSVLESNTFSSSYKRLDTSLIRLVRLFSYQYRKGVIIKWILPTFCSEVDYDCSEILYVFLWQMEVWEEFYWICPLPFPVITGNQLRVAHEIIQDIIDDLLEVDEL